MYKNKPSYYKRAIKEFNQLYYPDKKIDLVFNKNEINYPKDIRHTPTMSINFSHMKIYREELDIINSMKTRITNPATDFLMLLSYAVCQNVDTYYCCSKLKRAHCYISLSELFKIFHTNSVADINKKLVNLKLGYHALDYEIKTLKNNFKRYYFYFTCCNDQIITGAYNKKNPEFLNIKGAAFAAKIRKGFFLVNKYWFSQTFFPSGDICSHGIKDLYILLRLNTSYQDNELLNKISDEHHIITWGTFDNKICSNNRMYITVSNLSKILHNNYKNVYRYILRLQNSGMIEKRFVRNKGLIIINTYLDLQESNSNNSVKNTFDQVEKNIYTFDRFFKTKTIFHKLNINESKEKIKKVIILCASHTPNYDFIFNDKTYQYKIC